MVTMYMYMRIRTLLFTIVSMSKRSPPPLPIPPLSDFELYHRLVYTGPERLSDAPLPSTIEEARARYDAAMVAQARREAQRQAEYDAYNEACRVYNEYYAQNAMESLEPPYPSAPPPPSTSAPRPPSPSAPPPPSTYAPPPPSPSAPPLPTVTCGICMEVKPDRVLSCGHVWCHVCLERMHRNECPTCRASFSLDDVRVIFL